MKYLADETACFSPSELKVADWCLRQYYYKYIKKIYLTTDLSTGLLVGKLMHNAIERVLTGPQNPELNVILNEELKKIKKDTRNVWTEETLPLDELVFLARLMPLLNHITSTINRDSVLGIEEHLVTKLDNYHSLRGYLDIRYRSSDTKMKFADFKFGKQAKSESDILPNWYQFVGYRKMITDTFEEEPDAAMLTGSISFAAKPKKPFTYKVIPVDLNFKLFEKELLVRAQALTEHIISGAGRENLIEHYPPTGRCNGVCSYCDYIGICSGLEPEPKK